MIFLNKKIVLIAGILLFVIFSLSTEELGLCRNLLNYTEGCPIPASDTLEFVIFSLLITMLPFSLITYRMKEEVFQKWIRFAVWYLPILIIAVFLFPTSIPGGLGIGMAYRETFNILVLILLFSIFIITSTVKIIRSYRKTKILQ